ncbi:MAG: sigma 54-interacting transcriptional regulator [Desulfobacterales bacterium]|jgi:PAS domain S-box-containing protein
MTIKTESQTQIILDSIADGVFTVDSDWRITSFNKAAERITGIQMNEAIGRHCWEVFRASICEQLCAMHRTIQTGKSVINQSIYIVNADGNRIPVSISTAILRDGSGHVIGGVETFRDLSEVEELKKELTQRNSLYDIVSKNKAVQQLFDKVELVAESETTVLIEGESGTGKELFAKAIHAHSHRKNGPFVTINCGAMPDTLLESELFGYKAGAFTDAKKDKPGRLALAAGGTLFLDEIGDISPMLQVRLLRVLQDRTYEPLGNVRPEQADVRFLAATNRNLRTLVEDGRFRKDLFYRINVVRLSLPPLRERKEDIPLLIDHFIRRFNQLNGKEIRGISPDVLSLLMVHDYPGNIRELENIVEYAVLVCRKRWIEIDHLPDHLRSVSISNLTLDCPPPHGLSVKETEKQVIMDTLHRNNWNRSAAARELGIHPTTLWRKVKRLGISLPLQDGRSS